MSFSGRGLPHMHSFGAHLGQLGSSNEPNRRRLFVRVNFEVRCETAFGETLTIVGDAPQLGSWKPQKGFRMDTSAALYPVWRAEPLLLSETQSIEYKFVIVSSNGQVRWEPLMQNRRLELDGPELQVRKMPRFFPKIIPALLAWLYYSRAHSFSAANQRNN